MDEAVLRYHKEHRIDRADSIKAIFFPEAAAIEGECKTKNVLKFLGI